MDGCEVEVCARESGMGLDREGASRRKKNVTEKQ